MPNFNATQETTIWSDDGAYAAIVTPSGRLLTETTVDVDIDYTTDSIAIPLRTGFDFTDYLFVENDQDEEPGNTDKVTFSYQRENIYINRACAFKAIYTQLSANRESDNNNWIQEIVINEFIVENENKTHVTIFH